jgi:hypothetical protein
MFAATSRYYGIETATLQDASGQSVIYVRRRFLPDSTNITVLIEHVVTQGDRLDNIAGRYLGNPELFWQVCDANTVMRPEELTVEIGRRLNIPLP